MNDGGLAAQSGALVAYLASLGGSGAVAVRLLFDWFLRDARRPSVLHRLDQRQRAETEDVHRWFLWLATVLGASIGVVFGVVTLAIDSIQR